METNKTYDILITYNTIEERYKYLQRNDAVAADTFGHARWLNQVFYKSREWRDFRNSIIIRDNGCELGVPGYKICGHINIHHIVPITKEDILNRNLDVLLNPNNVICCSDIMHKAIHYGSYELVNRDPVIRRENDTCPWKK